MEFSFVPSSNSLVSDPFFELERDHSRALNLVSSRSLLLELQRLKDTVRCHIFQKAQVTSNKMEPKRNFLAQFFMAFLVVWFILSRLLAFCNLQIEASYWMIEEF